MPDLTIKEIKKKIYDEEKKVIWLRVDPIEFAISGMSTTDTREELQNKLNKDKKLKNLEIKLYRLEYKWCVDKLPNSGPMYLRVKTFVYKDKKIKKQKNSGQEGYVWFKEQKIDRHVLNFEILKYLILLIERKTVKFGSGIVFYHNYL